MFEHLFHDPTSFIEKTYVPTHDVVDYPYHCPYHPHCLLPESTKYRHYAYNNWVESMNLLKRDFWCSQPEEPVKPLPIHPGLKFHEALKNVHVTLMDLGGFKREHTILWNGSYSFPSPSKVLNETQPGGTFTQLCTKPGDHHTYEMMITGVGDKFKINETIRFKGNVSRVEWPCPEQISEPAPEGAFAVTLPQQSATSEPVATPTAPSASQKPDVHLPSNLPVVPDKTSSMTPPYARGSKWYDTLAMAAKAM